ncbi:hypothetical protein D3C80_2091430 [compost metagenome]
MGKLDLFIAGGRMQIGLNGEGFPQLAEQVKHGRLQPHPLGHCNVTLYLMGNVHKSGERGR